MAARGLNFVARTLYHRVKTYVRRHNSVRNLSSCSSKKSSMPRIVGFMTAAAVVVENSSESEKLQKVDPKSLTASYLLRNAAAANVDTAVTLFNQTVSTFLNVHEKYTESIERLLKLQDMLVGALGNDYQEQSVWDAMLIVRKEVNDYKAALTELDFVYASTERLLNNASEAAYLTGAEYASSVGSERLHAAKLRVDTARDQTRRLELAIAQKEAWVIQETAKHAESEGEKEEEKEPRTGQDIETDNEVKIETIKTDEKPIEPSKNDAFSATSSHKDSWFEIVLGEKDKNLPDWKEDSFSHEEFKDEKKWETS